MSSDNRKTSFLETPLKTSFARVAVISAMSFTAFMGAAMYGLPMLPGRALTEGETELLKGYFGQSIDYEKVKVHSSELVDFIAAEGFDVFTVGNTMFFPRAITVLILLNMH